MPEEGDKKPQGPNWVPRKRSFEEDHTTRQKAAELVEEHPLLRAKPTAAEVEAEAKAEAERQALKAASNPLDGGDDDPLAALSMRPADHKKELSQMEVEAQLRQKVKTEEEKSMEAFQPWSARKANILATYTTSKSLSITTSFLQSAVRNQQGGDKTKARLEQLEADEDELQEVANLSQVEYVNHIDALNSELIRAWENEERVKSLKIAIQAAKLLSDVQPLRFYPSKFALVTEILDSFGRLVYERIKEKAFEGTGHKIRADGKFSADHVNNSAKETCRNWFYKIASIRELLPRLYVEMAIMPCYSFLTDKEYPKALTRLSAMTRGLGDPMVGFYGRAYLVRVGNRLSPEMKEFVMGNFQDFLFTCNNQIAAPGYLPVINGLGFSVREYFHLFSPAIDWVLSCVSYGASPALMDQVFKAFLNGRMKVALILHHILRCLSDNYISANALATVRAIRDVDDSYSKAKLYRALGKSLVAVAPIKRDQATILNEVWEDVAAFQDPAEYMEVAEVFVEFPAKYCSMKDLTTIVGSILDHVTPDRAYEKLMPQLANAVQRIVDNITDFSQLFTMPNFMVLVDLFSGSHKVDVCKAVLECFARHAEATTDQVIINGVLYMGGVIHDSVNALTFEDEERQISRILVSIVRKVTFGRDFEAHLNFLVECRQLFSNVDAVKDALVLAALQLAQLTLKIVRRKNSTGVHTLKTGDFVRACLAYCFITIPSIEDVFSRLQLYLLSGCVALQNQCLPQSDEFLKTGITLVLEVPAFCETESQTRTANAFLRRWLLNLASFLVVAPGSPEAGPFHLIKGMLTVVKQYPWDANGGSRDDQIHVYLALTALFASHYQTSLPYHVANVESNDVLYHADKQFMVELQGTVNSLVNEILEYLARLTETGGADAKKKQGQLAFDCFSSLVMNFGITSALGPLAVNLFKIGAKNCADAGYKERCASYVYDRAQAGDRGAQALYKEIAKV